MLRPGEFARPAAARAFTTELAWAGSPHCPRRLSLDGLIVIYHHRTFTGWTGSRMGCKQRSQRPGLLPVKSLCVSVSLWFGSFSTLAFSLYFAFGLARLMLQS